MEIERIYRAIDSMTGVFLNKGYIEKEDVPYVRNRIFRYLKTEGREYDSNISPGERDSSEIMEESLNILADHYLPEGYTVTELDEFIGEVTDCLMMPPSAVIDDFLRRYEEGPEKATDRLYSLMQDAQYIKSGRNRKNVEYSYESDYGDLLITVNLAKPEKTPEEIALARNKSGTYPACMLCTENVGLGGIPNPPRQHHRIIPMELLGERYHLQYSPYAYFNEHLIVLNDRHVPMKVDERMLPRLMDFTRQFPHLFICSNADIPVVGGSILSHDHFQGGRTEFPVEKCDDIVRIAPGVSIVDWPVSTVRLMGDRDTVLENAEKILKAWLRYENRDLGIINPFSKDETAERNTSLNYLVRFDEKSQEYTVHMLLRNNSLDEEGEPRFHTRKELQLIKKENIGIIEAIGLAILPGRLKKEMEKGFSDDSFTIWKEYVDPEGALSPEELLGWTFQLLLEDVGVFKLDEEGINAFAEFLEGALGIASDMASDKSSENDVNEKHILENDVSRLEVSPMGAAILNWRIKGTGDGKEDTELLHRYINEASYKENPDYLNSIVGPLAGRYTEKNAENTGLYAQSPDGIILHGGENGYSHRMFHIRKEGDSLICTLKEKNDVPLTVRYTLEGRNLRIDLESPHKKGRYLNLTSHLYFSLGCKAADDLSLRIPATAAVVKDGALPVSIVPAEEYLEENPDHDFRIMRRLGDTAIDDCFILNKDSYLEMKGKVGLRLRTSYPSAVIYTYDFPGDGADRRKAIAVEPQYPSNLVLETEETKIGKTEEEIYSEHIIWEIF